MKKTVLLFTGVALLLAGCAKVETKENIPQEGKHTVTLKATVSEDTRISIDESGNYAWQNGDGIVVLTSHGARYGTTKDFGLSADFDVEIASDETIGQYAFYPGVEAGAASDARVYGVNNGVVQFFLDWYYEYVEGSTYMPMLGNVVSDHATFRAVGGALKLVVENVPEDATLLRFTVNDMVDGSPKMISGIFNVIDGVISTDSVVDDDASNFTQIYLPWEGRKSTMEFYIPLPVGHYHDFTISFIEEGLDHYERVIFSKTAHLGGDGLVVRRNDIVIAPTLIVDTPDPYRITFSEETLGCFPELEGEQPKLRLPRDYFGYLPIEIISDYEWDIGFECDEKDDWFDYYDDGRNRYFVATEYLGDPPTYLRAARMILTCSELEQFDENYQPIVIPIEEYQIITMVKDGEILWCGDWLSLPIGKSLEITAYVECPPWLELDENPIHWVYNPNISTASVDARGNTCTVAGWFEGDYYVNLNLVGYDLYHGEQFDAMAQWLGFAVFPNLPYLNYEGVDITEGEITVGLEESFTVSVDLSGIPEEDLAEAYWFIESAYDWSVEPPVEVGSNFLSLSENNSYPNYSATVTVGDEYGYDALVFYYRLNEKGNTEEYLYCNVLVSPLQIHKNGVNVTDKTIKVAPGEVTTLTAFIDDSALEAEHLKIEHISWLTGYGEMSDGEYVQGTGNPLSLTYESEYPYTATVSTAIDPLLPKDVVVLSIILVSEGEEYEYEFVCYFEVATPYPLPAPSMTRRTTPGNRHINGTKGLFKRHSNRQHPISHHRPAFAKVEP